MNENKITQTLSVMYAAAANGLPSVASAQDLASGYGEGVNDPRDAANPLICWQVTRVGTSGFASGVGPNLTLPVAVPANIASVLLHRCGSSR